MPGKRKYGYRQRLARRRSEHGRMMANARWARERARRAAADLAGLHPHSPRVIARRIVVIVRESVVREAVIYEDDSLACARRKERAVLYPPD